MRGRDAEARRSCGEGGSASRPRKPAMRSPTGVAGRAGGGLRRRALIRGLTALLLLSACSRAPEPQRLPTTEIEIGGRTIPVEVARTREQREVGMMHRRKLGPDEGMLFVLPRERDLSFYMKNTYVPLSIAFIRSDGAIANIAHMEPLTLSLHKSRLPCRYALEMPQGWFGRHGVHEGARVEIPAALSAAAD